MRVCVRTQFTGPQVWRVGSGGGLGRAACHLGPEAAPAEQPHVQRVRPVRASVPPSRAVITALCCGTAVIPALQAGKPRPPEAGFAQLTCRPHPKATPRSSPFRVFLLSPHRADGLHVLIPELVNVTLFGERILADVMETRLPGAIQGGPEPVTRVPVREEEKRGRLEPQDWKRQDGPSPSTPCGRAALPTP